VKLQQHRQDSGEVRVLTKFTVSQSVGHMVQQLEEGFTLAAADHILVRGSDDLLLLIEDLCCRIQPEITTGGRDLAEKAFTMAIRIGLNLAGLDSRIARIPVEVADNAVRTLTERLPTLEEMDASSARLAVELFLKGIESVNSGDSLPGYMAERIRSRLAGSTSPSAFILAFGEVARGTVYWRMVEERYCKFGNDYARGLEVLRHLGFSQVSTNPVLAARAFDEDPSLRDQLAEEIRKHEDWMRDPEAHRDEMALSATLMALWPNLEIFRPLAVRTQNMDYMISFQLNPNIADDADASIEDAKLAYGLAAKHLAEYDRRLGLSSPGAIPPNIVLKVAGSSKAARLITRELNAAGIGTNNTVVYTVGQEIRLILDSFEGKARALKAGKPITRTYETNMGGRLVSHLREVEASKIFAKIRDVQGEARALDLLKKVVKDLGLGSDLVALLDGPGSVESKADKMCSYSNLKSLTHPAFLRSVEEAGLRRDETEQLENDIRKAGTLVARRVYQTFFTDENRSKWIGYLQREYGLTSIQARSVLESVDVLPASKRIPEDTYDTLAYPNMCNTEFPNHARAVQLFAERKDFDLACFSNAAARPPEEGLVERLSNLADFVRSYEITSELSKTLATVGAIPAGESYGLRGISEEQWPEFGSVIKTMAEFRAAYEHFTSLCVALAKEQINLQ